MKHRRIIDRFVDWSEGRIAEAERLEIQLHLDQCHDCRRYFEKMTVLMEGVGDDALPHLDPDPFLSVRIRANETAGRAGRRPVFGRLAASIMGAAVVAAAAAGILIGAGLSSRVSAREETQAIVDGYYNAFAQDEIPQQWEDVLTAEDKDGS
jgi:anti-sigma factor RsiW